MNLLPFTVRIRDENRDENLEERLKPEWPAILQWMIEGCYAWQERGLDPPKIVRDATEEYLDAESACAAWISACCDIAEEQWSSTADLYGSWRGWAERNGYRPGTINEFSSMLGQDDRVYARKDHDTRSKRGFKGLRLVSAEPPPNNDQEHGY